MNTINGYIEINGDIYKITSISDFHHIMDSLGQKITEKTKEDFEKLTSTVGKLDAAKVDDCEVLYSNNCLVEARASMEQYKVKEGTKVICSRALLSCRRNGSVFLKTPVNINKVTLPITLLAIGEEAFLNNRVETIIFYNNIQYIGKKAFSGCWRLKFHLLRLPKKLRYLEAEAFEHCSEIDSVIFGDEIKEIGSHAFRWCDALKTVYIPNSIENIGSGIFDNCSQLKNIFIPKGTKSKFAELFPFDTEKLFEVEENGSL